MGKHTPRGFRPRRFDVELSADTRRRLADVVAAHDDDSVSLAEFSILAASFGAYLHGLPETERDEAAFQLGEVAASSLVGRRVVAAGTVDERFGR